MSGPERGSQRVFLSPERFKAILFDMDGVITNTAVAHAAAWKRMFDEFLETREGKAFTPFDAGADYLTYVDGKPRYEGVESFLASRNIELPWGDPGGDPGDDPETDTICGLGNRKNRYFHRWLDENTVCTFGPAIALIRAARHAGIRVAVFSSSRNCERVLENAGILELFDARVDGTDVARLGLAGKPEPAIMIEASARLGVPPAEAVVVEDAISGVEAGAKGRFGLVIGVNRAGKPEHAEALNTHGADVVVDDLAHVTIPGVTDSDTIRSDQRTPGWSLVYDGYVPGQEGLRESLCALGNGYFVTRGAAPDARAGDVHYPGTYLAGGYNRLTSTVSGRDIENEDLVNIPNWLPLTMRIDGARWLQPDRVEYRDYHQELDLRDGLLLRTLRFEDTEGRITRWQERRFVSMADPHTAALSVTLTAENWSGRLTLRSELDGSVTNDGVARYRALEGRHLETVATGQPDEDVIMIRSRLVQSRLEVAQAARTRLYRYGDEINGERRTEQLADVTAQELEADLSEGHSVTVEKIVALHTSRDWAISEPALEAVHTVRRSPRFGRLLGAHTRAWARLWEEADIAIETGQNAETALKLRLHIFHLLQTACYHTVDLDAGIPPRGWHGEAYRGHIMWDELFIFPYLSLRMPIVTRTLLRYRDRRLDAARRLARDAGCEGAMFPWQSGSDGREESQKIHLNPVSGRWIPDNSHRQRHINGAIAWNVWQYYQVTEDREYLYYHGAELMLEISRFWSSIATYNRRTGRYEIKGVMGPDEFHTAYPEADPSEEGGLDNNAYTNILAAWALSRTGDILDLLPENRRNALLKDLDITGNELARWDDVSRRMYVPFHDDGIISQFEGYERLQEFDWEAYTEKYGNIQRLDRILEGENDTPNRYKVSKQADVLMLFYLFSADELALILERLGYHFDRETIPKNIEYYMARTSHGSTLSWVVHAWILARADRARSWELFCRALNSDVADIQGGTTPEGIHLGAMAGTVDVIQRCLTGIEPRANVLHFDPCLPDELDRLTTTIRYRRHTLDVDVTHDFLTIASRRNTAFPITVAYRGHVRDVTPGDRFRFRLLTATRRKSARPSPSDIVEAVGSSEGAEA